MPFPVFRSILSSDALLSEVIDDYDVGAPLACTLLGPTTNDSYLIKTTTGTYVLRVYRSGGRSLADIGYELDALIHLDRKGIPVSFPIRRVDGGFVRMLEAPEGPRPAVLFSHAAGRPRHRELNSDDVGVLYGQLLAAMHQATDDFSTPQPRLALDLHYLLDRPLATIRPFLEYRATDWTYLVDIADRLRERVTQLSATLNWGFCHGDFHGWNVHVTDDNAPTVFDFDCCGPGWRALDLAIFRRSLLWSKNDSAIWPSFVRGYGDHRPASGADMAAVASFVPIWEIWLLGSRTSHVQDWGILWLEDRLNQGLSFLREWETSE